MGLARLVEAFCSFALGVAQPVARARRRKGRGSVMKDLSGDRNIFEMAYSQKELNRRDAMIAEKKHRKFARMH
jgi:hypothetical protein